MTVPEMGVCIGAETNPPASATQSPRRTLSPFFTIGLAGAPICCDTGSTTSAGRGRFSIGFPAAILFSAG